MSAEAIPDDGAASWLDASEAVPGGGLPGRERPKVSGDLPTVLQVGPMFRRAVAGYDRFEVDSYVRWAEDELATAEREREHLLGRSLRLQADLEEAQELLSHSAGGGQFLETSRRIGSVLATAADEAEGMRAEAAADRAAASAEVERMVAGAQRVLADARNEADGMLAAAATEVTRMTAEAQRVVTEAESTRTAARAEAEARLATARAIQQRTTEHAEGIRRRAVDEAAAARLHARQEIVRMLGTARDERRRADAEAADGRQRQDADAAARRARLEAEIAHLEGRRAAVRSELDRAVRTLASADRSAVEGDGPLARIREWLGLAWPSAPVGGEAERPRDHRIAPSARSRG